MYTPTEPVRSFGEAFDFQRAAGRSWAAIKAAPLILWVGGLYRACTTGGGGGGGGSSGDRQALLDGPRPELTGVWTAAGLPGGGPRAPEAPSLFDLGAWDPGTLALVAVFGLALVALAFAFTAWLLPGWHRVQAALFRTGKSEWGTLFTSFDAFQASLGFLLLKVGLLFGAALVMAAPLLLWDQLLGTEMTFPKLLLVLAWALPCVVVLVYVYLGLMLADRVVALEGAGAWEGVVTSWRLMRGNRVSLVVFGLVVGLLSLLLALSGLLAFCIGLVVTIPLAHAFADLCITEAYLHLTRPPEETESWALQA